MIVKNIIISEIRLVEFDPKTKNFILDTYTNDGIVRKTYKLALIDTIPEQVLHDVKKEKFPRDDEDDEILPGIKLLNIKNDEEVKAAILRSLLKLSNEVSGMRRISSASDYMGAFKRLSTVQEIIYKK